MDTSTFCSMYRKVFDIELWSMYLHEVSYEENFIQSGSGRADGGESMDG